MIFVYVTCKDKIEAKKIAKEILKKKLAICANIFPIESLYWWDKKITQDKEVALILKTQEKYYKEIEKEIKKLHSYKIPFIGAIKIEKVNKEYLKWLTKELK